MKKLLFLLICFCTAFSTTAQVRFSAALGANTGIFVPTENPDLNYVPTLMPNLSVQMAIKKGESAFSGIVQVNLAPKRITIKNTGTVNGQEVEERLTHTIQSGELLLGAAFDIELKNITIRPHAGIFLALNQVNGFISYSKNGTIDTLNLASFNTIQVDEPSLFVYSGINVGCSIVKRLFDNSREVAFFTAAYFAPRDIFTESFNYSWLGNDYTLQGKYHSLNVGIRIDLNRSEIPN